MTRTRTLAALVAVAALAPGLALAQSYTPRRDVNGSGANRTEDHTWKPQAYGVQAPGDPAMRGIGGVQGVASTPLTMPGGPPVVVGNGNPNSPTAGRWVAGLQCVHSNAGNGSGRQVWVQTWRCEGGPCNPLPGHVVRDNVICHEGSEPGGLCQLGAMTY